MAVALLGFGHCHYTFSRVRKHLFVLAKHLRRGEWPRIISLHATMEKINNFPSFLFGRILKSCFKDFVKLAGLARFCVRVRRASITFCGFLH